MNIYSTATVGDGLMSQIPALLISVATGMIVTRSASENNLNEDVAKQFLSKPMLPSSSLNPNGGQEHRFADTAIVALVKKLETAGANPRRLKAKIAGGAQMFPALNNSAIANIGKRNIDAVREALGKLSIPIVADDTGKDYGRTLFFSAEDGSMDSVVTSSPTRSRSWSSLT